MLWLEPTKQAGNYLEDQVRQLVGFTDSSLNELDQTSDIPGQREKAAALDGQ